jgi:thymidylate kinase
MFSVALIGPDGAGKTTMSRMLLESSKLPLKCIYMGINIEASNHALPSSRFIEYLRAHAHGKSETASATCESSRPRSRARSLMGTKLWAACRLSNRLMEECYRQLLSWAYQACGKIVLYDRHFLFDFSLDEVSPDGQSFDARLHRWFLHHLYPRPDLVIYLDAPPEVLFARKGEKSVEELARRRQGFLRLKDREANFSVVDATQPIRKVYADVLNCIVQFRRARRSRPAREPQQLPARFEPPIRVEDSYSRFPR